MNTRIKKSTFLIYLILFMAASAAILVTNVSYDAEYELAMGYRMMKGDIPIIQMWEPNQTSAFLCAILMKLYVSVTGTTTGIVLFMNGAGYLLRVIIAVVLYKLFKKILGQVPALIAAFLYILIGPKDILVPDYSSMVVWFSTLTALFLVQYFEKKKIWQLLLSALFLCLGVISYPSFVIAYIVILVILWKYGENPKCDIWMYTGACAFLGVCYVIYLMWGKDLETVMNCVSAALAVEPTHTVSAWEKVWGHVKNVGKILGTIGAFCLGGLVTEGIISRIKHSFSKERWLMISWYALLVFYIVNILRVISNGANLYPYMCIVLLGFCKRNLLSAGEKRAYDTGLWIGLMALLAAVTLSDQPFLQSVPFMLTSVCFSILPLYRWYEECCANNTLRKMFLAGVNVFLLFLIFRCIYIHIPIYGRGQICSLSSDLALIRKGPAMGLITDEQGAARQRDSYEEWLQYIQPGDTIWILGEPVDTMGYLYVDVEVGAPSVMSTPTYNEELLYYWELNPDKYPDVVILSSSYGELIYELAGNEWLMNWLEEEYQAETVIDGHYWRYYFKDGR